MLPVDFGKSINLSSDGSIVYISAVGSNNSQGKVYRYDYDSSLEDWVNYEFEIESFYLGDSFGTSMDISNGGSLIVGSPTYSSDIGTVGKLLQV